MYDLILKVAKSLMVPGLCFVGDVAISNGLIAAIENPGVSIMNTLNKQMLAWL